MTRRLHPGWLVALFAAIVSASAWMPWLTTTVGGGGWANAIGGTHGNLLLPPGFGAGQLIVVLSSALLVAGAVAGRGLSMKLASIAALIYFAASGGAHGAVLQAQCQPADISRIRTLCRCGAARCVPWHVRFGQWPPRWLPVGLAGEASRSTGTRVCRRRRYRRAHSTPNTNGANTTSRPSGSL